MQHSADSRGTDGPDGDGDRSPEREPERHVHEDEDRVYGITTAETSHTQEITRRQKQYILTMLVRVVSIIVVVTVPGISWPVKIGLCVVATIIPYVAVVRANGGPIREEGPTNLVLGRPGQHELGAAERGLPSPGEREDFIVGEWVRRAPPEPGAGDAAGADVPSDDTLDDTVSSSDTASSDDAVLSGDGDAAFGPLKPDLQFIRAHSGDRTAADPPATPGLHA